MDELDRQKLEIIEIYRIQDQELEKSKRLIREAADLLAALLAELEEVIP